ncbi:hypothetical protein NFJ02_18g30020 [Pycnococcus provasolii]
MRRSSTCTPLAIALLHQDAWKSKGPTSAEKGRNAWGLSSTQLSALHDVASSTVNLVDAAAPRLILVMISPCP